MKLTVFTPTYNRKSMLQGLYDSILRSSENLDKSNTIEWLIINDGSSEDYSDAIKDLKETDNIKIHYIEQDNGGKHTAFNRAIDLATGESFVCIDDDDRLTENAFKDMIELIEKYEGLNYGAIVGRVVDESGALLGSDIEEGTVSNTVEIRDKYHHWGEPEVYYTNILKRYRFKVFPGERFLTEAFLFDDMSHDYPFVYVNNALMVKKYLKGGLTDNQLKIRVYSPMGTVEYYVKRYGYSCGLQKIKAAINKVRFRFWLKDKESVKLNAIDVLIYCIAFIMYKRDVAAMNRGAK